MIEALSLSCSSEPAWSMPLRTSGVLRALLLLGFLALPSARLIYPLSAAAFVAYCGAFAIAMWALDGRVARSIVAAASGRLWLLPLMLCCLCVSGYVLSERNNALKEIGADSTGDDQIIEPFRALLSGQTLYSGRVYDGSEVSAGPAWVVANGVWSIIGMHYLMSPAWMLLALFLMRHELRLPFASVFLLSPLSVVVMGIGHDLPCIGIAFLCLWLALERCEASRRGVIWLAILSGVLATSRVIYGFVPLVFAVLAPRLTRRGRWWIAILGSCFAVACHVYAGLFEAGYPPTHVLRNRGAMGPGAMLVSLGCIAGVSGLTWMRSCVRRRGLNCVVAFMAALHGCLAVATLLWVDGDVRRWEGANYTLPAAPMVVYWCVRRIDWMAWRE